MRIPPDASVNVQSAFREVWEELDKLRSQYVKLPGQKIGAAKIGSDRRDYATLGQVGDLIDALRKELS